MLHLLVLAGWPYVVHVLWGSVSQSPWLLEPIFQECPLWGLCVPSCGSWTLMAVGSKSVHGTDHQVEWLWGLTVTTAYKLLVWGAYPIKQYLPQWALEPGEPTLRCSACGANWVVLCCGLNMATVCVFSNKQNHI